MFGGALMKKVLIIEDDKNINEMLQELLSNNGYNVSSAYSGTEALLIHNKQIDLIVLDLMLPGKNGEEIIKKLKTINDVPIIITTAINDIDKKLDLFELGADDYITKPYNPTILLLRIQNIFKRMDNNMDDLFYDNISVNPQKGILKQGENVLELTKNEMIVFTYLLSNRGRIVTRDDLMTDLWNNNEFINDNALTVNISRLRNKLQNFGLENRIETRKGQGYKLL